MAPSLVKGEAEQQSHTQLPAPRMALVEPLATAKASAYLRLSIFSALCIAGFALLALRLWSLQVMDTARYARAAVEQSTRVLVQQQPRGVIVDAKKRLLAVADTKSVITANPRELGSIRANWNWSPSPRGHALLARLARISNEPLTSLIARIRSGLIRSPYTDPVVVPSPERDLSFYLLERQSEFPGLEVTALPARHYPQGALGSEFLGLLGEINSQQLKQTRYRGYQAGELIGQSGVEATYDRLLRGSLRETRIAVGALGQPVAGSQSPARSGAARGLQLTIDARLQRATERALRDGIGFARAAGHPDADAGAAVVMNPRTGAIDALASYPNFNQVAAASNPGYLAQLLSPTNQARPLIDRATQGLYPPGSTFKPIVAEAALASGLINSSSILPCTGSLTVGNRVFNNVEPWINADLSLPSALAISCDTWFYRLGVGFYTEHSQALAQWAQRLGIGRPTGIDLPGEASAEFPKASYEGDSVNLSIGQGALLVTPLQLAVAYSALANGGTIVQPHVGSAVLSPTGKVLRRLRFPARARLRLVGLEAIRNGLYRATHDPDGTSAAIFGNFPVPVAGKTGTAQAPEGSDDSWYASWAPANHPRVVVVVLIEHGGFGAQAAAPAAREIYSAYFHLGGQ
ncbi:MAG: penicillin-binding transpeptidase domain-containing protein [Gaiellaceae bacterium]